MAHISVGPQFFRSELRVYSDWRTAFARELLQNSIDANASAIHIDLTSDEDGLTVVGFFDDGDGMPAEDLERVYFRLGETTKTGGDTIGGYGRARMITCFAQTRYELHTRDQLVTGSGGDYHIAPAGRHLDGTRFTITTIDDYSDDASDRVHRAFRRLLATCAIPIPVYLDGRRVSFRQLPDRARRVFRDDDGRAWGKVYAPATSQRIGPIPMLLVRVSGLTMFSRYIDTLDHDVIVELDPGRARQVLAASRDRLAAPFDDQLDGFVTDLAGNRRKAFAPATPPLRVRVFNGGFSHAKQREDLQDDTETAGTKPTLAAVPSAPSSPDDGMDTTGLFARTSEPARAAAFTSHDQSELFGRTAADRRVDLGFDVFMLADTADSRVKALARAWDPSGWDVSVGRRRRALLKAWKAAVDAAVDHLVDLNPSLAGMAYAVGWTFDEDARAMHTHASGGDVLALNPVDEHGRTAYKLSGADGRRDLRRMLASAVHEVAHVAIDGHDEDFASMMTALSGTVDQAATVRLMQQAATDA